MARVMPTGRGLAVVSTALALALGGGECLAWRIDTRPEFAHGKLGIDHGKTIAEISKMQVEGGLRASYGLGLFLNRLKTEVAARPLAPPGKVKRLALNVRVTTDPVIYVAKEFAKGSCAYQAVLAHELLHQAFDLEALGLLARELPTLGAEVLNMDESQWGGEVNAERLQKRFLQRFKHAYDDLSFPRHVSIDNPESYARFGEVCDGEIARKVAAAGKV